MTVCTVPRPLPELPMDSTGVTGWVVRVAGSSGTPTCPRSLVVTLVAVLSAASAGSGRVSASTSSSTSISASAASPTTDSSDCGGSSFLGLHGCDDCGVGGVGRPDGVSFVEDGFEGGSFEVHVCYGVSDH